MTSGEVVAAVYDIHGNLTALEAVLAEIERLGIGRILVGGDIAWGPQPRETTELVMRLGTRARLVRGNADREVSDPAALPATMPIDVQQISRWCTAQLQPPPSASSSGRFPPSSGWRSPAGAVYFCHGSPRGDEEAITAWTPEGAVGEMVRGVREATVVCGHTHAQFEREAGGKRVVNPGSVGLHQGYDGACWAVFGRDGVEMRLTRYDVECAVSRVRRSGVPGQDEFISFLRNPTVKL